MKKILIVDDDPAAQALTARFLLSLAPGEIQVEPAFSGAEAMERIKNGSFDLILSDVRMPNGSGIDLLRELQRLERPTPVILMSAEIQGAEEQAKAMGAQAFVAKPFTREDLQRTVGGFLQTPVAAV